MSTPSKDIIKESVESQGVGFPKVVKDAVQMVASQVFESGALLKDAMGLSDDMVEAIYSFAYHLYTTGKYDEALMMFRLLIMLNPMVPKYTLGLAACFHMQKDFKSAASSYILCSVLDPKDPLPHYHASDCFSELQQDQMAEEQLNLCLQKAGDKPEFTPIKSRAEVALEGLKIKSEAKRQVG